MEDGATRFCRKTAFDGVFWSLSNQVYSAMRLKGERVARASLTSA